MEEKKNKIALFDFDGTLTRRDTLPEILSFIHGKFYFIWGLLFLSPILLLYKINLLSAHTAKERLYAFFLKGISEKAFREKCDLFVSEKLPSLLRPDALKRLLQFKEKGFEVVVISASSEDLLASWCEPKGLKYIATKLEVIDGKLTGNIDGENCNGPEKARRIKQSFDLSQYEEIHAFGDSKGDFAMLKLAGPYGHYRHFK